MNDAAGAVDAHVHLWDLDRMELSWFRPGLGLPAAASVDRLAALAGPSRTPIGPVRAAIAVQAADSSREAHWLSALRHPLLAGTVLQYVPSGGGDEPVPAPGGRMHGVRVAVPDRRNDLADVAGLDLLCERVGASRRVVEFLVRPEQLPAIADVAARHPGTRFVLCHLGLGASDPDEEWAAGLRGVAARPNVAAKASGIVNSGTEEAMPRLSRALAVSVGAFGPGRLAFGSDWPMAARVAPYDRIVSLMARALPPIGTAGEAAFWGGTARALYRL